jgi:hypothetical protein
MSSVPNQGFRQSREAVPSFYQEMAAAERKIPLNTQSVPSLDYSASSMKGKRVFDEDLSVPACLRRGGSLMDSAF